MPSYKPTREDRLEEAKRLAGPVLAGLIVLGLGAWLAWREWGPKPRPASATAAAETGRISPGSPAADAEIAELEAAYRRAVAAGAGDGSAEALLDRLIARQRERVRRAAGPGAEETLARFEAERGSLRARAAAARSAVLEQEAAAARAKGQLAAAGEKLREALHWQREANRHAPSAELKNVMRETQLAAAAEHAAIEPLQAAFELSRTLATAAAARGSWSEATKAYADAREQLVQINRAFPQSRLADAAALARFDTEVESAQAAGLAAEVAAQEREGDAQATRGSVPDAAAAYAKAIELQRAIDTKYPRSRYASATKADELAAKSETVQARGAMARAAELDREAAWLLRQRQPVPAAAKAAEAAALLDETVRRFPRSRAPDAALRARLGYLSLRRNDLAAIHAEVDGRLVVLPGTRAQLLRTEVPQELYTRVMNANPSRQTGRGLPVDSVNWAEAQDFCQRLSWVLGTPVRLPLETEFRAAARELSAKPWSAETADGRSREVGRSPPNAGGWCDLAGNLAEWLQPADAAAEAAPVAGGSYLDTAEALRALPVTSVERRSRLRHVGFRFVVEPTVE